MYYEISIVCMDDSCDNSTKYIDIACCHTVAEASKKAKRTEQDLKSGKYNYCLKDVNYVYVNALPYDDDLQCLLGLAWSYNSDYYSRKGNEWKI